MTKFFVVTIKLIAAIALFNGCKNADTTKTTTAENTKQINSETPEYFLLRPEVEKAYGYSHAVKIGNET